MGRFHFQTDVGSFAVNELSNLEDVLKEKANSINSVISSLEEFSGFGIGDIVTELRSEIETTNLLGSKAKSGAETLRFVISSSDNYANIASTIVTAAVKSGADAINNVVNEAKNKTDTPDPEGGTRMLIPNDLRCKRKLSNGDIIRLGDTSVRVEFFD